MDRIDLQIEVPAVSAADLALPAPAEGTAEAAARVAAARDLQRRHGGQWLKGKSIDGLCEAKACAPWFENQKMPRAMIGKKVKVTLATGVQRDASGKAMGKMTSFKTLDFVK